MGGIGEVSTKEQYRSQGHARKLLQVIRGKLQDTIFICVHDFNFLFYGLVLMRLDGERLHA
jgi:predicted acetyltransferase